MTQKIKNEFSQAVFNLPWLVADAEGLFAQEGIEVEFMRARSWDPDRAPEADPTKVDPFWRHAPFEEQAADSFNACEWGQVRRASDNAIGARILNLRPALASQAIFARPDSDITHPSALRNKTVAVNFHAGSHYLMLQLLEGFMPRDEIKAIHKGEAKLRFRAMMDGTVDAAMLMEPFIAIAEKAGCTLVVEGFYAGSEMLSPQLDQTTVDGIHRAVTKAVKLINADKKKYLHYIMEDIPEEYGPLAPEDFRLSRLRYVDPRPYPQEEFQRTYDWMMSWNLIREDATFESLMDSRVATPG